MNHDGRHHDGRVKQVRRGAGLAAATLTIVLLAGCGGGPAAATPDASTATATTPARSSPAAPTPAGPPPTSPPTTSPSTTPDPPTATGVSPHTFPVTGTVSYAYVHHDYPATDIIAACGLAVRAVIDGTILEVSRADVFDPQHPRGADKGGLSVSLLGVDGVRYYGSHLSAIAAGIETGARVQAGQQLGVVGKTGNANNTCHLHFGISPPCGRTGDWWIRRGVVWPWEYLDAWRAGRELSPVAEVARWQQVHGCSPTVPPGTV